MSEFAECPGQCDAKVKVHEGSVVNFCCHNCWRWYWESTINGKVPYGPNDAFLPHHSEQCEKRQMSRVHEQAVGGEFVLNVRNTNPSEDRS